MDAQRVKVVGLYPSHKTITLAVGHVLSVDADGKVHDAHGHLLMVLEPVQEQLA